MVNIPLRLVTYFQSSRVMRSAPRIEKSECSMAQSSVAETRAPRVVKPTTSLCNTHAVEKPQAISRERPNAADV